MRAWFALAAVSIAILPAACARVPAGHGTLSERGRFAAMFARGYVPGRSGQLFVVPDSGYFLLRRSDKLHPFQHGTPWPSDTRIPLLFWGAPFVRAGTYADTVSLQSVAPTLLGFVRAQAPPSMTGRRLDQIIAGAPQMPAVVVLIMLDGMGRATWDHWESSLTTLRQLKERGAWFENATLDYLPTVTAVGHATVSTGTDPRFHGIHANAILEGDSSGDMYHGRRMRPDSLRVPTLADVWARAFPESAAIVVHGTSSRATVALAGHGACLDGGRAITVAMLDERLQGWFSGDSCYQPVPASLRTGTRWASYRAHQALPDTSWELFLRTPWLADLEGDALVELIRSERLGRHDRFPDLLLINLKTPDYVSHRYGPMSVEADTALRHLDRALGRVVNSLTAAAGSRGFVLAVTADHGMPTARMAGEDSLTAQSLCEALRTHFGLDSTVVLRYYDGASHQLYVDRTALAARHHTLDELRGYLETLPRIRYAFTEDDLQRVTLPAR